MYIVYICIRRFTAALIILILPPPPPPPFPFSLPFLSIICGERTDIIFKENHSSCVVKRTTRGGEQLAVWTDTAISPRSVEFRGERVAGRQTRRGLDMEDDLFSLSEYTALRNP